MYTGGARRRLAHLWQLPLLFLSIVLFVCAAILFVDGRPQITLDQQLAAARAYLRDDRPDAAVESITRLLSTGQFPRELEGQVHLALAEALEATQEQRQQQSVPAVHARIIEETQIALAQGVRPSGEIHRRLGESFEALGKPVEAVGQYRQAIAIDPARAIQLQRKVIDLQLASSDWVPAEASLDAYLAAPQVANAERAWATSTKAQLLIDRGDFAGAQRLLESAIELDQDEIARAESRYRLGICAWKLGKLDEAQRLMQAARAAFRGQHALDADAAYALGRIAMERDDPTQAAMLFDMVIASHPQSAAAPLARISRGVCRILQGEEDQGLFDLRTATELARSTPALREEVLAALRRASATLSAKQNQQGAIELLECEQSLDDDPPAEFFARLSAAQEKRAEQIEQSIPDAAGGVEKLRRQQLLRETIERAAAAQLAHSRALLAAKENGYGEALWKAIDLYDRAGNPQPIVAALELLVAERAADPVAPQALLRLGQTYEALAQAEKAISAYQRLQGAYADSPAARQAAVPLALLYIAQGPASFRDAEAALLPIADGKPEGEEHKRALMELGTLYHRTGQFERALPRFEAFATSFADDARSAEASFLAAECYRALAQDIDVQLAAAVTTTADASGGGPAGTAALNNADQLKKSQLAAASRLYEQAQARYRAAPPTREIDRRFQKLAALRRADCDYELEEFANAIGRYRAVVQAFAHDPVAVAASVQIVNCLYRMNRIEDARAANEQAHRLLETMPQGVFESTGAAQGDAAGSVMSKAYFEQWLRWTGTPSTW